MMRKHDMGLIRPAKMEIPVQRRMLIMNRWRILMASGLATLLLTASGFAQTLSGPGFSVLLCIADEVPGQAQVGVEIGDDSVEGGIGEAEVEITHGRTSSTHDVIYEDSDGSNGLNCGDTILSVT